MRQLRCADLKPGDLMLKAHDGTMFAKLISFSERLVGQLNPLVMHAGLMFDSNFIIEAQNDGIGGNDLRVQDQRYGYIVYRASNKSMAQGAGTCAKMMFDINQRQGTLKYNFPGLPGAVFPGSQGKARSAASMDELLSDILEGRGHRFFCSQFVVYVYQFVAEQNGIRGDQVFSARDARVSPSTLASLLQKNAWFKEAGYLLPNER